MTLDEPPEPTPPARMLGWIWIVVGGVAVAVGLVATVFMVVVFGLVALVLGAGLLSVANVRDRSRRRTARTLSGDPPPPATAPYRPPPARGPTAVDEPHDEPDEGHGEPDEGPDEEDDPPPPSQEVSASDVEDGYGNELSDQDRPGRRPGVADDTRDDDTPDDTSDDTSDGTRQDKGV